MDAGLNDALRQQLGDLVNKRSIAAQSGASILRDAEAFQRHAAGETYKEIAASWGQTVESARRRALRAEKKIAFALGKSVASSCVEDVFAETEAARGIEFYSGELSKSFG
jgi:predicted transcriptional regulator